VTAAATASRAPALRSRLIPALLAAAVFSTTGAHVRERI